ncbi:MAG: hypothetical protein WCX64_03050 [Candidatus Micrarchaeia archaeon]
MATRITQRKHPHEEDDELEPSFDQVSGIPPASNMAMGLPEPEVVREEEPVQEGPKEMRTAIDLPGVKIVQAAHIEHDQIISAAKAAADRTREEARKNAAQAREETLAAAVEAAQKERVAIIEKAKKGGLAFKAKKSASVPKVASAVFSKVFKDMF